MTDANRSAKRSPESRSRRDSAEDGLPESLRTALGAAIRSARKKASLTLAEVADRSGFSVGMLGNLERGEVKNPPLGTLLRVMGALDLDTIESMLCISAQFPSRALVELLESRSKTV